MWRRWGLFSIESRAAQTVARVGGGASPVAGREGAVFVPPGKEALRLPGRESLHPAGKAALGQLVGGERAGKAHPQHPVPVREGGQDTGGEGEIAGGLGQSQRLQ